MEAYSQPDPLGKAFAGSMLAHAGLAGLFVLAGVLHLTDNWGNQHASSGSIGVNMVPAIPIPRNEGHINPLASDTKSLAPQKPAEVAKPKPEVKAPEPKAIELPSRLDKRKPAPKQEARVTKPLQYQANQVYADTPQAVNSPLYGKSGASGIDIGPSSVLGSRFGAYVDLMRQRISQNWNTADVRARPSDHCAVTLTIARNGSVSNVQVSQPSGNYLLDTSAKRAILDANPLPPLPQQYEKSEATVELVFQLRQ